MWWWCWLGNIASKPVCMAAQGVYYYCTGFLLLLHIISAQGVIITAQGFTITAQGVLIVLANPAVSANCVSASSGVACA